MGKCRRTAVVSVGDPSVLGVISTKEAFQGFEQSVLMLLPRTHAGLCCLREGL